MYYVCKFMPTPALSSQYILDNNNNKLYDFFRAEVAELVDALDSKSSEPRGSCRFDSGLRHQDLSEIF